MRCCVLTSWEYMDVFLCTDHPDRPMLQASLEQSSRTISDRRQGPGLWGTGRVLSLGGGHTGVHTPRWKIF